MENKYLDNPEVVVLLKPMECENTITRYRLYIIKHHVNMWKNINIYYQHGHLIKDITKWYGAINILMH